VAPGCDKMYKYRLEAKLISAAAAAVSEIIANLITGYRVEMELNVNRCISKRTIDTAAN